MESTENCSVAECGRPVVSIKSGLCRPHYRRLHKYGRVDAGPKIVDRSLSVEERFWANVTPTGFCWEWNGRRQEKTGHGRFSPNRTRSVAAHRFAYELLVGTIPVGLHLDHLCRNTRCVNPDHVEPVTPGENVLRGFGITAAQARQTHCKNGHEFTPENTWTTKTGMRHCRVCSRAHHQEWAREKTECVNCGKMRTRGNMASHMKAMHA